MENEYAQRTSSDLEDINEKLRKDVIRSLEAHGARQVEDLSDMTEIERTKWLFWNLHERLDDIRLMEPTLIGHVTSTQLTVSEGQSMLRDGPALEKRLELSCKWNLLLSFPAFQNEKSYEIGEGWINLCIADRPPVYPSLHEKQRGYLNGDHSLYPNQLFLDGWITEPVWQEIKAQLYTPNPNCRTDVMLLRFCDRARRVDRIDEHGVSLVLASNRAAHDAASQRTGSDNLIQADPACGPLESAHAGPDQFFGSVHVLAAVNGDVGARNEGCLV
jgi:hypothetical protein